VSEDAGIEPRTVATTTIHMKTEKERQVADRGLAVGGVVESQMDYSKHRVPECPFFRRNRFLHPSPPVSVSPLGPKEGEQHSLAGKGGGWGDPIQTTRQSLALCILCESNYCTLLQESLVLYKTFNTL
jgi:hypothetical protein